MEQQILIKLLDVNEKNVIAISKCHEQLKLLARRKILATLQAFFGLCNPMQE